MRERSGGVEFGGSLEAGYRACLWSRVASRVLLEIAQFDAADEAAFYQGVAAVDWAVHIDPARTIACEFTGTHSAITNTHFGALRLKDGICDRLRADAGSRPDVAVTRPAVRIIAHAQRGRITLSLDLAGEGLHRRGYRLEAGEAPLRENLAAGLLLRARWDEAAARGAEFLDPLCGSGTLVIEAAMIAADRAPGLTRDYFGFLGWRGHDAVLWQGLLDEATQRVRSRIEASSPQIRLRGTDADQRAIAASDANAQRAGIAALVRFDHQRIESVRPLAEEPGLVCTNPPYGERLGNASQAVALYAALGSVLREHFAGWEAAVLVMSAEAGSALRLRSYRSHELWNGAIACRLLRIDLAAPGAADAATARLERDAAAADSDGARMFSNRLEKNLKRLGKSAKRAEVECYRLYDADMPEYAFAIDRYLEADGGALHLHVQEYAAPREIDHESVRRRRREVLVSLPRTFTIPPERIHVRLRKRQSGTAQYEPVHAEAPAPFVVREAGLRFLVNLDDYLDTGLFLDHRLTRARLRERSRGARFLNLFCYTASATVYAAAGGAPASLSIDMSNRYLDWASDNLALNAVDPKAHRLERADCLEWLSQAPTEFFDLIFLDPPTFSNSKRMQGVLDIQRDHLELIGQCMKRLSPGGLLVFSCNAQRFRLDEQVSRVWQVRDVSAETLPFDFARNPRVHRCFEIQAL